MAERGSAGDQLGRILALLPYAARQESLPLAELAEQTGISIDQILRDLTEVYTRSYYHPAGGGEDTQVLIEADRVEVFTTGEFRRPTRFSGPETIALGLGLRSLAAEEEGERRERILELAGRLESSLGGADVEEVARHFAPEGHTPGAAVRPVLLEAARERRRCRIQYLKPGDAAPEWRELDPYLLVSAEGNWYVIGQCGRSTEVRSFRLDRILNAVALEEFFDPPDDFDPADHLRDGHVFHPVDPIPVEVVYSPNVARWILERGPGEPREDGSVLVRHEVADPRWLVRHVLGYGRDAEVLTPEEFRSLMAEAVERLAG